MEKFIESFNCLEDVANNINEFFTEICTTQLPIDEQQWNPSKKTDSIPDYMLPSEEETYTARQKKVVVYFHHGFGKKTHTIFTNQLTQSAETA